MPDYLDCNQAAEIAKCSIYKIRDAIKTGELDACKPGRSYVIECEVLDRWIKSKRVKKKRA